MEQRISISRPGPVFAMRPSNDRIDLYYFLPTSGQIFPNFDGGLNLIVRESEVAQNLN